MWLGIQDFAVFLAWAGSILVALVCVVYGFLRWNPREDEAKEIKEELDWEKKDPNLNQ